VRCGYAVCMDGCSVYVCRVVLFTIWCSVKSHCSPPLSGILCLVVVSYLAFHPIASLSLNCSLSPSLLHPSSISSSHPVPLSPLYAHPHTRHSTAYVYRLIRVYWNAQVNSKRKTTSRLTDQPKTHSFTPPLYTWGQPLISYSTHRQYHHSTIDSLHPTSHHTTHHTPCSPSPPS
jgi:hypothetical protein